MHSLTYCQSTYQNGTFLSKDEPTLAHHNHSKSTVYLRAHYWWYTFYGFEKLYNYINNYNIIEYFHSPPPQKKTPLCSVWACCFQFQKVINYWHNIFNKYRPFISYWVSFGRLYFSRNWSISLVLSNL